MSKTVEPIVEIAKPVNLNRSKGPTDFVTLNKQMISKASAIVKESKNVKIIQKPTRNIHDVLKANGDQHDKIPRYIFEYAVNYGRSTEPTENKVLTYIRKSMSTYPRE